jgi:hypothetical protein
MTQCQLWTFYGSSRSHSLMVEASDYSACANVASKRKITTKCTSCTERPLPRPSGYEPVLFRRRFARSTCTWTVNNIPHLMKTLHQSYNDGMVNPEVVCYLSMAKTTVMHANSLPNVFSNNELISNRFAVFVTCTHILTYL